MNEIIITRSHNTDIWFLRTVKWYMFSALSETIGTTIMANPLMPTMLGFWNNSIHYKEWDEIIYQYPNFNSVVVDVCWEWISKFIQHLLGIK